jgi:5-methylcytosine-specific restriction protein A
MKYPHYKEIESPLLQYIYEQGGDVLPKQCYRPLGKYFDLSEMDMSRDLNRDPKYGGKEPRWNIMVQWARESLAKAGLLSRSNRGRWKLTELGFAEARKVLSSKLPIVYPDEISSLATVIEGAKKQVIVNRYERSTTARDNCIAHWKKHCLVCGFDFLDCYGERGRGFIHVHHLKPLREIGESYKLNPVDDLRPVCPNCHAMLHRTDPPCSIEELQAMVFAAKKK